eukprot:TRINITY_DN42754_c0_g1_i1.p4 TRINITY_DN42754_c0_g1~~TRINITY_DN42754_c0_g1_i1.p4  ORF type:complete len:182 (+),score=60.43 TRINITY_DN42754_c0_g1_i1:76-546(+)
MPRGAVHLRLAAEEEAILRRAADAAARRRSRAEAGLRAAAAAPRGTAARECAGLLALRAGSLREAHRAVLKASADARFQRMCAEERAGCAAPPTPGLDLEELAELSTGRALRRLAGSRAGSPPRTAPVAGEQRSAPPLRQLPSVLDVHRVLRLAGQ